jgi:uncharacterized membrane protein YoaK (UPF0700 family)
MDEKEKQDMKKTEGSEQNGLALGMCLGVAMGAALGSALGSTGAGVSLGLCLGMCIGALFDNRARAGEDAYQPEESEEEKRETEEKP